ncbi:MAG: hypothetical protein V9G19_01340 [Tetrasphaera sp.]
MNRISFSAAIVVLPLALAGCGGPGKADFEKRLDEFSLLDSYELVHDPEAPPPVSTKEEYAVRFYRAPAGADICADLDRAFRAWAKGKVQDSRGGGIGCQFTALDDDTATQQATATPDETGLVRVDMFFSHTDF